ncbi:type I polyketide synthase [Paraburkholderia humisilvae]|uniref:Uncharacterized protein n=1 Tax=Paraburkholderia humisilvae TaxID=627669 RepID=A0A6J5F629_9BURK|nr:type I polyketide synthase [Paraburkholderia humisilvae]CAB3774249.1 hypothetical protein LMG29542_07666 [Paraburkholderia humisilvae]
MEKSNTNVGQLAIVGMACRFPGGNSTGSAYWQFLNSGRSAIRETPRERFDIDACYSPDPDEPGTTYSRVAGYVDDPFHFDREFFRISAAEAIEMDPQQRWMLELTWAALENAGIAPSRLRGKRVGLFMTTGEADYGRRTIWSGDPSGITTYSKLGNLRAMAPGRVAHVLGFNGPAVFVDTTCSSSLVAIHLAAQSLRTDDCDIAIAGGVNLILGPEETIGVARLQAMSPSGHCRPFDAAADGYIRGEGGGVIVLKRYDEALKQGDRIDAVLAGSAINSDGASNGLTAPNGTAQEAVIRHALARAGVRPEDVEYIEAHGTGTSLGDPIELSALRNVYTRSVERPKPILVGSVKSQVGHLEGAAGMAGIIKAMLILRHRFVPAQVNFAKPNPRFLWDGTQLDVPREGAALDSARPVVGVSGFGITGTNVHLILAAHDVQPDTANAANAERERVLTLSGRTSKAREQLAIEYRNLLQNTAAPLRAICCTASVRRDHFNHRLALVGSKNQDFIDAIDDFLSANPSGKWHAGETPKKKRIVFLVPGQGAWQPGIGAQLYAGNSIFRRIADTCLRELDTDTAHDVLTAIHGNDPSSVRHHPGQLAHFIVCFSLASTWIELGQTPDLLIGHSLGEHVAAVIAGVMTIKDGLKAVEARGRLFDTQTPRGAMLAIAASVQELHAQFEFGMDLFVAGINGPEQTVVSGTRGAVQKVQSAMVALGKRVSVLKTYDTPGHSPMLNSMYDAFRSTLQPLTLKPPRIPIISTLTGQLATDSIDKVNHWLDLVEQPVRFHEALLAALDGNSTFIEVGPGAALSKLARAATSDWQCAVSSLADGPDGDEETELTGFAHACARLYSLGHEITWDKLYGKPPRPAELPTYPFDDERFELPFPERKLAGACDTATARRVIADIDEVVRGDTTPVNAVVIAGDEANASGDADRQALLGLIRSIAASVASDTTSFADDVALVEQGMDSLALTELRIRLHKTLGKMPPMSMLARGASLVTIAGYIASSQSRTTSGSMNSGAAITKAGDAQPSTSNPNNIDERSLVVPLREGDGPVIALVHPVGGDVLCYQELAASWPGDPSVVAIRHPYSDQDVVVGYLSIKELASLYRSALKKTLKRAPDLLGGWSFGGLVALEIAAQWKSDDIETPPLLLIDSPFYEGKFASRLKALVAELDCYEGPRLVDMLLADARFDAMLDQDFYLSDVRSRANPDIFAHIARLHASGAAALSLHHPQRLHTSITYAFATRGKDNVSAEHVLSQLRALTNGKITMNAFDEDHNSIIRRPCAAHLARFLSGGTVDGQHLMLVTEA